MKAGEWLAVEHRCPRPAAGEVEFLGAGPGSVWKCYECAARHRVVDVTIEFPAGYAETVVRWEVERVA